MEKDFAYITHRSRVRVLAVNSRTLHFFNENHSSPCADFDRYNNCCKQAEHFDMQAY